MAVDPEEFKKFSAALRSSTIRKSFAVDPLNALEKAGVDISKIPIEAVDAIADLSPNELATLANLDAKLKLAGDTAGYVVF
jgi:hypothetical protein